MHQQFSFPYAQASRVKNEKSSKSNANFSVKKAVIQLQQTYWSEKCKAIHQYGCHNKSVYLQVIDLTEQICTNLLACSKSIKSSVDLVDVLMNNFILGVKIKNGSMVGGFVFILIKYLSQGLNNLVFHLQHLRKITGQSQFKQNYWNPISSELLLACQNLHILILPSILLQSFVHFKIQNVILNALISLSRSIQNSQQKNKNKIHLENQNFMDPQQIFYHNSLKAAKISKFSKRNCFYKELLASYFKYVSQMKVVPTLDTCKLLIDAITIDRQNFDTNQNLNSNSHSKSVHNDIQLTGFLIRKCFVLISENYMNIQFFIEDHLFAQTVKLCLKTSPYNMDRKNITQIIQTLIQIKKIDLAASAEDWMTLNLERSKNLYKSPNFMEILKYLCSCLVYLLHIVIPQFNKIEDKNKIEQIKVIDKLNVMKKSLQKNVDNLMQENQQIVLYIFDQIISTLFTINSNIFLRCQQKDKKHYKIIQQWSVCSQIQNIIISNQQFRKIRGTFYLSYQYQNTSILIIRQYIRANSFQNTDQFSYQRLHPRINFKNQRLDHILEVFKNVDDLVKNQELIDKLFRYWDQLVNFGALFLQNCENIYSLQKISALLRQLIKCEKMIGFAHNILIRNNNKNEKIISGNRINKIYGIYNLILVLQKLNQNKLLDQPFKENSVHSSTVSGNFYQPTSTKSNLHQFMKEKERIRKNLFSFTITYFFQLVLTNLLPFLEDQYYDPNKAQNFAFEQILAHLISIIPQLYSDLTLQERISIYKLRKRLIEEVSSRTLDKFRYVFHRNFTFLLQQYYILICKDNTASKTLKKDEKIQAKANLINCLDSYVHLYRKGQSLRKSLSRRNSLNKKRGKKCQDEQTVVKSFNNKQQCTSRKDNYNQGYHDILYIDFMQWVTYYTENKDISDILAYVKEIMEEWLEGLTIQQYLIKLFQQIIKNDSPTTLDLQLLTECTSKLLYLRSNKKCKQKKEELDSGSSQINNLKMNIEFEVQQASFHIRQLNQILSAFNTFCREFFKDDEHLTDFLQKNWYLWSKNQNSRLNEIKNFSRMNICLNNIIGVAVNIGHTNNTNHNRTKGEERSFIQLFSYVKLLICRQCHTVLEMYTRYGEMVFLGYAPIIQAKLSEIKEYLQERKDQKLTIAEENMLVMIKLFLGMIKIGQNNLSDSQIINSNSTLKQIFIIQNLKHMHPHKYLLRSISSHIFNIRQMSQTSILKYEQPLLPITYSILIQNEHKFGVNMKHQVKNILQFSNSQIEHKILQYILIRVLQCLLLHGQLSQFRSILRLSAFYFVRARNLSGILLSLYCYFMRVKNMPLTQCGTHYASQTHRKSQIQSIPSKNNPQELFTQLDMLSISDSLSRILQTIFTTNFDKRNYDKFCKIILTNKRRTSMSFHVSFQSVIEGLARSLSLCGPAGAEVFLLLGDHACKVLECKKQSIMYRFYIELCQENGKKYKNIQKSQKGRLNQEIMKAYKKADEEKQSFRMLQWYLVQKIKSVIAQSYYHALLIQNLLSNIKYKNDMQQLGDVKTDDEMMLDLCVLMLDHNYTYKRMIQQMHKISIPVAEQPISDYVNQINMANDKYQEYVKEYLANHSSKMSYLMSPTRMKYPLTIIYPFGSKVYLLAVQDPLITLQMDSFQFDEHINTIDNLILNNSRLLNDKNVDPKQWWKSRDRVNRSIGKIVNEIGIFLWDVSLNSYENQFCSQMEKKLWKLIYISMKACIKDYKKIKTIIESAGINTQSTNVDQIILSVNSFVSQIQCGKSSINQQQNLLLLIHPHYSIFPYEQNSYLSRERAVYRIPSIEYILQQTQKGSERNYKIINISNANYLVNSGNDLPETEKNFYKIKSTFPLWKGIVGRKPTLHEFFNLFSAEAYLFMGHGGGNGHIREKQFYNNMINCLILLFGCSSASMSQEKSQFNGISYSHLINGAPGLLGCLWEVTDKDTDRVTQNLFKSVGKEVQNLSKLLSNSKRKCKHQYLNGGSIIVFGLPIYVYSD